MAEAPGATGAAPAAGVFGSASVDSSDIWAATLDTTRPCIQIHQEDVCAYYGDLHTHTGYSDGEGVPEQAFQMARSNGLDILAVTDHAEYLDSAEWDDILAQAVAATEDGSFVGLRGFEWTSAYGHINVYGSDEFVGADMPAYNTLDEMYAWLSDPVRTGVVAQFNHPDLPSGAFNDFEYHEAADTRLDLLEISSGSAAQLEKYRLALDSGWHVSPSNNSDTHTGNWGVRRARTGIIASDLTYHDVIDALRTRRTFSTQDPNLMLAMRADGFWMGSELLETPYSFDIYAFDPDPADPVAMLEFYENGDLLASTSVLGDTSPTWNLVPSEIPGYAEPPPGSWWNVKAIQSDGEVAYSSSIWTRQLRQYDVLVRDSLWDQGAVPSINPSWQSPDVWIRLEQDGQRWHQNPVADMENYVYARVRNIGSESLSDVDVYFYWSDPALGFVWPQSWSPINDTPVSISDLAPRETRVVSVRWDVPRTVPPHTCLFVRIVSSEDPIRYDGNAKWDNNIGWKNVHIVNTATGLAGREAGNTDRDGGEADPVASEDILFDLVNPLAEEKCADVHIAGDGFPGDGTLVLRLAPGLFDRWMSTELGGVVKGGIVDVSSRSITLTHPVDAIVYQLPLLATEVSPAVLSYDVPPGSLWNLGVSAQIDGEEIGGNLYTTPASETPEQVDLEASARRVEVERSVRITATVMGEGGVPVVDGTEVAFRTTLGSLDLSTGHTRDGSAAATLDTGGIPGKAFVQAAVPGAVTGTLSITIEDAGIVGLAFESTTPDQLGQTSHFTASVAAGTNVTYTWVFGDGATGNGQTISHEYGAVGSYRVTLTGTNSAGDEVVSGLVVIEDVPISGLALDSTSPDLLGETTHLLASVTAGTNVSYVWAFGDGKAGSGQAADHEYGAVGRYTVTLTGTNGVGSEVVSEPVVIEDVPISGLALQSTSPDRLGETTWLTASVTAGTNITYAWALGDGATGSGRTASHEYDAAGSYAVILTATNSVGSRVVSDTVIVQNQHLIYLPLVLR